MFVNLHIVRLPAELATPIYTFSLKKNVILILSTRGSFFSSHFVVQKVTELFLLSVVWVFPAENGALELFLFIFLHLLMVKMLKSLLEMFLSVFVALCKTRPSWLPHPAHLISGKREYFDE